MAVNQLGWLPLLRFEGATNPVVQVVDEDSGEIVYTVRASGDRFQGPVFSAGRHTVKVGRDKPDTVELAGLQGAAQNDAGERVVKL